MQCNGMLRRIAVLALVSAAACNGDGGGGGGTGPAEPASIVAVTATTQNAVVASPVPVPPAVRVSDKNGQGVAGVEVRFGILAGEGTVVASSVTDAGGVAVAANWVMGTVTAENVLRAWANGLAPVEFRAAAAPGEPTAVQKAGGDAQSAVVGTVLADSIAVRVVDQYGNGVPRIVVNFTASAGTLSAARVTTGAQGEARVSLALPTWLARVQVHAGSGTLPPQTFVATATAGPPAAVTQVQGGGQSADTGTPVPVPPTVRVVDSSGNPVAGHAVAFVPAAGSGVVTGGAAVTGADGHARVTSWVLGQPGLNRLTATVAGLNPVEFTATSLVPCGAATYTLFETLADVLRSGRCTVAGRNAEVYSFTVTAEQCVEFRMNSSQFDTYLHLLSNTGSVLAANDDGGGNLNSLIRWRVSPGTYRLAAAAFAGGTGTFQLTSSAATGCTNVMGMQGEASRKPR